MRISFNQPIAIFGLVVCELIACAAFAAAPGAAAPARTPQELEEVVVSGARLRELRAAVIESEDRLIARYNDLNKDNDFDIECLTDIPTGTHLSYRKCRVKLQARAQEDDSWNWITSMLSMQLDPGAGARPPPPLPEVQVRLMARAEDYKKNLAKLLEKHPELRELAQQHGDARRRYEQALRKGAKSKIEPIK